MGTVLRRLESGADGKGEEPDGGHSGPGVRLLALTLGVSALFYLFCILSLAWIGLVLSFYLLGCLAALWAIGFLLRPMKAYEQLAVVILKSFRLHDGPDWHVLLSRDEAPGLHCMVEEVAAKIGTKPPDAIFLVMDSDAAVRLQGYDSRRGRTELFIGFDTLAVSTKDEIGCAIAHEMAHSKLVVRAHDGWVRLGVARGHQLGQGMRDLLSEFERKKIKFHTAAFMYRRLDRLMDLACRVFARYRRQEELAADRLAAECGGSETYGRSLLKGCTADYLGRNIDWRDRKVYCDRETSFSDWLREALTPGDDAERERIHARLLDGSDYDKYSTHPALRDRLAALPKCEQRPDNSGPGIELLANPDMLAASFIGEMEKIISAEEQKDTSAVRKRAKKKVRNVVIAHNFTSGQNVGIVCIFISVLPLVFGLAALVFESEVYLPLLAPGVVFLVAGVALCRAFARRRCSPIPAPDYELWRDSLASDLRRTPIDDWIGDTREGLLSSVPELPRGKASRAAFWAEECCRLLGTCDFQGALAAADLCLEADSHHLEGLLTRAVSLAYFLSMPDSYAALNKAYASYPFGTSMSWGLGWTFFLAGSWADAEMYLLKAVDYYPDEPTVLMALATCQRWRGKLRESIEWARKSVAVSEKTPGLRLALASTLLDAGMPKEALLELDALSEADRADFDAMLLSVHAHALCGNEEETAALSAELRERSPGGKTLLMLARAVADAGQKEQAGSFYQMASESGFYPEALFALAHEEYENDHYDTARELLTSVLDCTKTPGDGSAGPLPMMEHVCVAMLTMGDAVSGCLPYELTMDLSASPAEADELSLLIYAREKDEAMSCAGWLYSAMHPGTELPSELVKLVDADGAEIPDAPIAPGIHGVRIP